MWILRFQSAVLLVMGVVFQLVANLVQAQQVQPTQAPQSAPNTGLIFATPQQLRGVPLASMPFSGSALSNRVDLSSDLPTPGFQGGQNSCVGWAVAYGLKSYHERVELRWLLVENGAVHRDRVFSPSYIYNQINNSRDSGAHFIDAFNVLTTQGAATWNMMPYTESDHRAQPSQAAVSSAATYRVDYWRQVNVQDPIEVKAQINAGYPVLIGAMVDEGFRNLQAGAVWRRRIGSELGGHAMVVVGFDDTKSAFKLLNSWSTSWGDNGYGWLDYSYFPQVVREAYVVKDAVNGPAPQPPQPQPIAPQPQPDPAPILNATAFSLNNVTHNVPTPMGPGMRFDGTINIPAGVAGAIQVVVQISWGRMSPTPGQPVGSLNVQFAQPNGNAATGTPLLPVPPAGLATSWTAFLPYQVLRVPRGGWRPGPMGPRMWPPQTSDLVAQPALFLDNFSIAQSGPVQFFVKL